MHETDEILQLWDAMEGSGELGVLATIVKTFGSSYRLPGARMLLSAGGKRAGSISGGCLEDDLVKKAWWLTNDGPVVRRYDTTPEGEIGDGFGSGCNGVIHVLLERVSDGKAGVLPLWRAVRRTRAPAAVAHVLSPATKAGQHLFIDTSHRVSGDLQHSEMCRVIQAEALAILDQRSSRVVSLEGMEFFIETLVPAVRLLVFGAGDDAVPLVVMAKQLGWQVAVFDGRSHYARREKFPAADEVLVREPGHSGVTVDAWTVAVAMSHSYSQDLAVLREFAPQRLRYLGLLGPRKRTEQLLADANLNYGGIAATLHAPMGLDIGADGPEQVALAVIAEIQAVLNGRQGGLLRERQGSIHARMDAIENDAVWVHSIICA